MSGGHWEYKNGNLADEIFGWNMDCHYGERGFSQAKQARKVNPLEDREVSEMLWDMLCLLHSYDYYISGDIGKYSYLEDLAYFKNKWLKRTDEDRVNAMKEDLKSYYEELIEEMRLYDYDNTRSD